MHKLTRLAVVAALGAASVLGNAASTLAEEGRIRIAQQFGIVYLLLNVAEDQKLIQKHGEQAGIDIDVEFIRLVMRVYEDRKGPR